MESVQVASDRRSKGAYAPVDGGHDLGQKPTGVRSAKRGYGAGFGFEGAESPFCAARNSTQLSR